jgi:hypothetical protein
MSEQTWMDTAAVQAVGDVFWRSAQSVRVASTEMSECSFGAHVGARYALHGERYAAGLLAVSSSIGTLVESSRQYASGLTDAATTLTGEDKVNATTFTGSGDSGGGDSDG